MLQFIPGSVEIRRKRIMNVRLMTVSRAFQIGDTPTVIEPGPVVGEIEAPGDVDVEIRRPDGTVTWATLTLSFQLPRLSTGEARHLAAFKHLKSSEVPIGSEIWLNAGKE
jgi:hypothetical protein